MDGAVLPGVVLLGFMFLMLACGVWVALSLLSVGLIGMFVFTNSPAGPLLATAICVITSYSIHYTKLYEWLRSSVG